MSGSTLKYDVLDQFQKKLKLGDIIVTKPAEDAKGFLSGAISKITGSPWTHSGLYLGSGKVVHMYPGIQGKSTTGMHGLKVHSLKSLRNIDRGLLALRPHASLKKRKQASKFIQNMKDVKFSFSDLLHAGFLPGKKKNQQPEKIHAAICSGIVALAYPHIDFRKGKSPLHVRPSDFVKSRATKLIAQFEKKPKTAAQIADGVLYKTGTLIRF